MAVKLEKREAAQELFINWPEMLITSCLQGVMGDIYADQAECPRSAMARLGDFCFLAGEPDPELVCFKPAEWKKNFTIMVPQHEGWWHLIRECYGEKAKQVTRYAFLKEKDVFDRKRLMEAADSLPPGYQMQLIDEALYERCLAEEWSRDLVAQYPEYQMYARVGLGVAVLKGEELAAGASSYASFRNGIEIEIDTKKEYRRQGLAFACGARLILECLDRGWYPSWDAQNLWSVGLAKKLGYHYDHAYTAFEIWGY